MTKQNCTSNNPSTQSKKRSTKQLTTAEFIKRARLIHADYNYDYSGVVYTNNRAKVFMICPEHGFFAQTAKDHLTGRSCRGCGIEKVRVSNTKEWAAFLDKAKAAHNCGNYSYEKVVYRHSKKKVVITCKIHGDFEQTPYAHSVGHGCWGCVYGWPPSGKPEIAAVKKRTPKKKVVSLSKKQPIYDTAFFIKRAKRIHGDLYDYSKSVYVDACKTKTIIICREHGEFAQTPASHLRKRGCPDCGKLTGGYSRSDFQKLCDKNGMGNGTLYVIKCYKDGEVFYKVGRTSVKVKHRFAGKTIPYDYSEIYIIKDSGSFIFDLERRLHKLLAKHGYQPKMYFEGQTECFTTIKPIEKLLKELSSTEQLQLLA